MIVSFRDEETRKIFGGINSRNLPPDIQQTARRKLRYLHSAETLGAFALSGRKQARSKWKS